MGKRVSRFDFCHLDHARVKSTLQGFLTVGGRLTRVGVLDYYRADGSVYRELRLPEEVFKADSLRTLEMVPVTDLHGGMVSPDNVQALGVGIVHADVAGGDDGPYVTGSATIQRADTIKAVQSRQRTELSPGYQCYVEDAPGEWDGSAYGLGPQKYDGIQRDIAYNHLAIGPKDWGRSGPGVALRMDGLEKMGAFARCDHGSGGLGDFIRDRLSLLNRTENEIAGALQITTFELGMLLDGFTLPDRAMLDKLSGLIDVPTDRLEGMIPAADKGEAFVSRKRDSGAPAVREDIPMKKITIIMDGFSYEVEIAEPLAANFNTSLEKLRVDAGKLSAVEGKLAASEKETGDLKTKLDAATDPTALQLHINARTQLVQDAKKIAPELTLDDRADDRTVKITALVANGFAADMFTEKTDGGFIDGCFASAVLKSGTATPPVPLHVVPGPEMRSDDKGTPKPSDLETPVDATQCTSAHADAAHNRMIQRNRDLSSKPFANGMTKEQAERR